MKKGITTGTCAQAAAKGAAIMLSTQSFIHRVNIETASGAKLDVELIDPKITRNSAACGVIKYSGDDPDVTDGVRVYAEVRFSRKKGIAIRGGQGVGKVTCPGLAVPRGEWAINPTPRKMIIRDVSKILAEDKGFEVIISVPEGKKLSRRTFNPRLGIKGGISILGTTGIVEPRSIDAYKASLALQLDILKARGHKSVNLVLGYVGERFSRDILKLKKNTVVKIGDHVGFMLKECAKRKIGDVLLIGHIGKLIKVANGQFNTHTRFGDSRITSIARYAESAGADKRVIGSILRQTTAEATIEILRKNNLFPVFDKIAADVAGKSEEFTGNKVRMRCIILSLNGDVLGVRDK